MVGGRTRRPDSHRRVLRAHLWQYARAIVARLYAALEVLADHPEVGRVVPEVEVDHIREIVREGYRVVYVVSGDLVEILAVLHSRQDLGRKLRRE